MCRWGCAGVNSTFMCKWCGTRYCRECKHGEFVGEMRDEAQCAKCNQKKCQGKKVEAVLKQYMTDENAKDGGKGRSRSASPTKRSKSGSGKKSSGGKSKSKSGGKKGGKKKKKK